MLVVDLVIDHPNEMHEQAHGEISMMSITGDEQGAIGWRNACAAGCITEICIKIDDGYCLPPPYHDAQRPSRNVGQQRKVARRW